MSPVFAAEAGEIAVGSIMCIKVRAIHGGTGEGYLFYKGVGGGLGTPISVWGPGSESEVVATVPMTVSQFAGGGAVGGAGIGAVIVGGSFNSIIFFCGPLPNVYWVPWGWAWGAGAGFSGTAGLWNYHSTPESVLVDLTNTLSFGPLGLSAGQKEMAEHMTQFREWLLSS